MAASVEGQVLTAVAAGRILFGSTLMLMVCGCALGATGVPQGGRSLSGTWALVAADKELPDGTVVRDYGEAPTGRLMIDDAGRYSLQIFRSERPAFAAGDKGLGTEGEMRAAVLGSSTHYGSLQVDWAAGTLTFTIEDASFPNWRGAVQVRSFELAGEVLTYRVPPRPDGSIPISVWRRRRCSAPPSPRTHHFATGVCAASTPSWPTSSGSRSRASTRPSTGCCGAMSSTAS